MSCPVCSPYVVEVGRAPDRRRDPENCTRKRATTAAILADFPAWLRKTSACQTLTIFARLVEHAMKLVLIANSSSTT